MSLSQKIKSKAFAGIAALDRLAHSELDVPLREVRNFLLLQHATALGTAIHSTPLIPALRHAVPGCSLAVVSSGFSFEILRNHPHIDHLIATPSPLKDLQGAVRSLRSQFPFRKQPFVSITSTGNERTLIAMQAVLSGASVRVGFTVIPALYQAPLVFDKNRSQIANNLRIVEALGHTPVHFEPEIPFSRADLASAKRTLESAGVAPDQVVAVFVTQTSPTQRKGWRAERFRAVANYLRQRYGAHILFVGTAVEAEAIDTLRGELPFATTSVAGKTKLTELAALMSLATVGLTLDTGPLHIGRSVGLPMAIIAPAWSPPIEWLPLDDDRFRILKNLDISSAPEGYVIDEVLESEAIEALDNLLARYSHRALRQTGVATA